MKYSSVDTLARPLSRLGLGAMRLPYTMVDGYEVIDQGATNSLVQCALEKGISIIDTAQTYSQGKSEEAVGRALKGCERSEVILSTKIPLGMCDGGKELDALLSTSLSRLGTSYLDILFFHALTLDEWREKSQSFDMDALCGRLLETKTVKNIFFSSHDSPDHVMELIDSDCFSGVLLQYNLLDRSYEQCFARARQKGLVTLVMGPVAGGQLAGKSEDWRDVVSLAGCESLVELCFRFVASNRNIDCVLSGMVTEEMVEENVRFADREPLTQELAGNAMAVADAVSEKCRVYCTWCKYCHPCPKGIHIPLNIKAFLLQEVHRAPVEAKRLYERIGVDPLLPGARADCCEQCGICEDRCPQNVPIMEIMRRLSRELGDG